MNQVLLSCEGFAAESVWIPPFQLAFGQAVCLHMPCPALSPEEDQVIKVFTGKCSMQGVQRLGRILWAEPAMSPRGFLGWIYQPTPRYWLSRVTGMSRTEAAAIVERLGLRPDLRLRQSPWRSRILLGLEVAWALAAEGIVFSVIGLDPPGRQAVFEAISARLDRCPAVYLSYIYYQNEQPGRDCFPGGTCVEATFLSKSSASTTPSKSVGT